MPAPNPTKRTYDDLTSAYDFFNERLFDGKLPRCLITMQRKNKSYGYFAGGRFGTLDGEEIADEIALNPSHFRARTAEQNLSTLVHEMVHLWQHHHGKPSRTGYHNKEWAAMMKAVGLIPSDTAAPGGKETGQHVSHYRPYGREAATRPHLRISYFRFTTSHWKLIAKVA
jgi:predicted SprT family Zn-dependent metalloprotease